MDKNTKVMICCGHRAPLLDYISFHFLTLDKALSGDVAPDRSVGVAGYAILILKPMDDGCIHFHAPDGSLIAHVPLSLAAVHIMAGRVEELLDPILTKFSEAWDAPFSEVQEMFQSGMNQSMSAKLDLDDNKLAEARKEQAKHDYPEADGNLDATAATVMAELSKHVH